MSPPIRLCAAAGAARIVAAVLTASLLVSCSEPGTVLEPGAAPSGAVVSNGPSSSVWQEQARGLVGLNGLNALAAGRVYAALGVAQYLAVVNADGHLAPEGALPEQGYGSGGRSLLEARRGAVAGASTEVLTFFFPAAAPTLRALARTLADAGPGDVHPNFARGEEIGRGAGAALVTRVRNDGFTTPWTRTVPVGPGMWVAAPVGAPIGATLGGVTPYLLTSSDQFRPAPPPAFGSAAFLADLAEIRHLSDTRTPEQLALARYWNFPNGTFTPPGYWNLTAASYVAAYGLDERAATHTFALMHAAMMDALIGCWEAKYHYWLLRPSQADPVITLAFPALPNHPSYPSGHSCVSAAAGRVLQEVFPARAAELDGWVAEAGQSRMDGGIHYRFDIDAGQGLGVATAEWAIAVDRGAGLLAELD
jgi:membrane-associated phospholipid phosphatase